MRSPKKYADTCLFLWFIKCEKRRKINYYYSAMFSNIIKCVVNQKNKLFSTEIAVFVFKDGLLRNKKKYAGFYEKALIRTKRQPI